MQIKAIVAGVIAAMTALTLGTSPAWAVIDPWSDGVSQGNVNVALNSDWASISHANGWVADSTVGDSVNHSSGDFVLYDGTDSWGAWCNQETSVTTEETNGDVVVDCDAQTPNDGNDPPVDILVGLSVTPQYRIYAPDANGIVMTRMLYKVENVGATDVTIAEMSTSMEWDEDNPAGAPLFSSAGQVTLAEDFVDNTDVSWVNSFLYDGAPPILQSNFTSFGVVWRNVTGTAFTELNGMVNDRDDLYARSTNYVIKAGTTQYFAFFSVHEYAPEVAPLSGLPSEVFADTNAFMALFDGDFSGLLSVGIPAGADVANWGLLPQPEPTLPDTGSADLTGVLVGVAALAGIGFSLLMIRRRRAG
jgi:LPXTG-motif cell wall-anchored protein